jgi:hypothetical protein
MVIRLDERQRKKGIEVNCKFIGNPSADVV